MTSTETILLVGASVRAAAFSALRAGLSPWCIDLFADVDLAAACPAQQLTADYPDGFAAVVASGPPGPWMYTGGLENHPRFVSRLARQRPLWGNDARAVQACRTPAVVARLLRDAGLPVPALCLPAEKPDPTRRWLVKPLRGAGGAGVRFLEPGGPVRTEEYLQEYIEGDSCAALFVGAGAQTILLGLTRQLVGVDWLHARPFHYCGSIGPLVLDPLMKDQVERLGRTLAVGCGLVGLFGVDGVLKDGQFWPVEVNPRYTASVEVVEYATGLCALAWHRLACTARLPALLTVTAPPEMVGKAILFASADLVFPGEGPWVKELLLPPDPWRLPTHADIPCAGTPVQERQPILTVLARGETAEDVSAALHGAVSEVETTLGDH
jgi:predicted ATP-grasp superfamily ATP-dependent carboligase